MEGHHQSVLHQTGGVGPQEHFDQGLGRSWLGLVEDQSHHLFHKKSPPGICFDHHYNHYQEDCHYFHSDH